MAFGRRLRGQEPAVVSGEFGVVLDVYVDFFRIARSGHRYPRGSPPLTTCRHVLAEGPPREDLPSGPSTFSGIAQPSAPDVTDYELVHTI